LNKFKNLTICPSGAVAGPFRGNQQHGEEYRSEVTAFELRKNLPVLQSQVKRPAADARSLAPVESSTGAVLHRDDVAAGGTEALFTRAEARDFIDVDAEEPRCTESGALVASGYGCHASSAALAGT
jgi:hypothetical protein